MTATPVRHDGFHKAMVLKATAPFGRGEEEHPIERGAYFADIWFEPTKPPATIPPHLGFWSEIARTPALVESCRSTPPPVRMTDIVARTLNKEHALRHHRDKVAAVRTWVITHGRPLSALEAWGARPHTEPDWPEQGIWRLATLVPIFVIVCRELPETPQTLLLRLMGARNTLRRALNELKACDEPWTHPYKDLLVRRHVMVAQPHYPRTKDDDDFLQQFADVADQFVTNLRQEGRQEGRQDLLRRLFGLRLQRPLTDAEADLLRQREDELGTDPLNELVLTATAEEIEAWLAQA